MEFFPELASEDDVYSLVRRISGSEAERVLASPAQARPASPPVPGPDDGSAPAGPDGGLFSGFLAAVLAGELADLDRTVRSSPLVGSDCDGLVETLSQQLHEQVRGLCLRTLVTDLHDYRERSLLSGSDSRERYAHFERIAASPAYTESLAQRFPGLFESLRRTAGRFVGGIGRILADTQQKMPELSRVFGLGEAPEITGIRAGMGDTHRGGRAVAFLDFAGGTRIVYKPRPMEVERAYHELARRTSRASGIPFGSLDVVAGEDCGWEEYAESDPPQDTRSAAGFYRNTGSLVCLLYFLRAMDVHYQNIVCRGAVPCLVDAETLLAINPSADDGGGADKRASEALSRSVKMIGLLPSVIENPSDELGVIDVGLLGYTRGQTSPFKSLVVVGHGRDDMRLEFRNLPVGDPAPAPRLDTSEEEIDEVVAGFETAYDWISGHRTEFSHWIGELFGDVSVRFVAENTHFYSQLLRMATHPKLQGADGAGRLLFHRVGVGRPDVPAPILRAEIEDLLEGDVPYFELRSGSADVFDSRGRSLGRHLARPPIDTARELVASSSDADRDRNSSIIRLSYVSKLRRANDRTGFAFAGPSAGGGQAAGDVARDTVGRIADGIVSQRIDGTAPLPPTWIGARISPTALQYWKVEELGTDFYSGSPGLAYFLGQAGGVLERDEWTAPAMRYFTRLSRRLVEHGISDIENLLPGMYTGAGGIAYAMHNLADTAADPELRHLADGLWRRLPEALPETPELDVLGGAAGLLGASLTLAERLRGTEYEAHCLETATAFYERTRSAVEHLRADPGATYYSGFAHGVSGVYPYLLRYDAEVGHPACAGLVEFLLDRERALFDEATGTWAIGNDSENAAHGWCHGAPGMLLAKCLAATFAPALLDGFRSEIRLLLDTVLSSSFGHNLTLCHGDLGNLQIVSFAAGVLGDTALQDRAERRLDDFARDTLPGLLDREGSRHVLAESVMAGRAGIGLTLLRRLRPDTVPPVLWFLR
ncbi:type 2 lanthipeptide synthetase LanM family protein [Streptomonospora salina]|uniref:Type 2 lantibiotic biosynthesis protein LanM n=1 Tax=Streptomonospora salina TaxID=104205 RepID=A0A841E5M0_9ACTN|nr:type 2 lanthipeptide synthetase LanM family protein [Streptomonospora salina]MBB5996589.1 type 2 lantibiotic biosynthesis protein LanM [Streptomonospora salina]